MKLVESTTPERKEHQAGTYTVQIIEADEGISKNEKATEYLQVVMETKGDDVFKVRHRFYNTEKAVCMLKQFLSAIGIDTDEFDVNDLLGQILEVDLTKDLDTGYLSYKVFSAKAVEQAKPKKAKAKVDEMIGEDEIPF